MREVIVTCIQHHPGIHFRELLRLTKTAIGQLDHHINSLVKHQRIISFRDARYLRYFPVDFDMQKMQLQSLLWNDAMRSIFLRLSDAPMTQKQVASLIKRSPSTVSWYLQRLQTSGMVSSQRGVYLLAIDASIVKSCLQSQQSFTEKVLSRFSEGWNG